MLNKDGQRELAYVIRIDAIEPIVGSDNCEAAVVGGWRVMVRKNTFKVGDLAIYFEIDSKVPETETFAFLEKKHYKVKTQKYTFGGKNPGFYSQGLLMAAEDFGWKISNTPAGDYISRGDEPGSGLEEGDFLTQELGVTYSVEEDNKRKAKSVDKYKKMAQRHPKLFRNPIIKVIYKSSFGKKLLFLFWGKKTDKKSEWPLWVVKTDEERIQNLTHMIPDFCNELWMITEKIDGSSTTFTLKGRGKKQEYAVCSRNVRMTEKSDGGWYETNIYVEMSEKYNMKSVLQQLLDRFDEYEFVTIQGETYGAGVQKRDYNIKDHDLAVFNVIFGKADGTTTRLNPGAMKILMNHYDIPTVPIVCESLELPNTCDGILALACGKSAIDGGMREGLVFRSLDGVRSFKAVDNEYLAKYHG